MVLYEFDYFSGIFMTEEERTSLITQIIKELDALIDNQSKTVGYQTPPLNYELV